MDMTKGDPFTQIQGMPKLAHVSTLGDDEEEP